MDDDYLVNITFNEEKLNNVYYNLVYKINNTYEKDEIININLDSVKNDIGIKSIDNSSVKIHMYYCNNDVYKNDIDSLKGSQLIVTKINKNMLEGEINAEYDGVLFMSCLYDDNLNIYVDGVKQNKNKLLNTFIGTDISKGKHKVILKYKSNNLYYSIFPSLLGFISLLIYLKSKKKENTHC